MVNPLRIVIDTNHIISATLSDRGASAKLIEWMSQKEEYFQLLLSTPIWTEYKVVADWLVPETRQDEKQRILDLIQTEAMWVEPEIRLEVCRDDSDNRFLECAVAGRADYLVTKNIKHFPYKQFESVKIVRVRELLDVLEKIAKGN